MTGRIARIGARILPDRWIYNVLNKLVGESHFSLVYHLVQDKAVPHVKHLYAHLSPGAFERDLDFWLTRFTPIHLSQLLDHLANGTPLPDKSVLFTFDDGYREVYEIIAPMLKAKGVPATFFLITDCLDNRTLMYRHKASALIDYLEDPGRGQERVHIQKVWSDHRPDWQGLKGSLLAIGHESQFILDQMAERVGFSMEEYLVEHRPYLTIDQVRQLLQQGFTIGSHSQSHPDFVTLSDAGQLRQVRASVVYLKQTFGLDYAVFAFPFSDEGVMPSMYDYLFNQHILDASFGTAGFAESAHPRHIQRLEVERKSASIEKIMAKYYARKLFTRSNG